MLFGIFFGFLTLTVYDGVRSDEPPKSIDSLVETKRIDEKLSTVNVGNHVSCTVYVYDPKTEMGTRKKEDEICRLGKSAKFFTCLNCRFAYWTYGKVMEFVQSFPSLYRSIFRADSEVRIDERPWSIDPLKDVLPLVESFVAVLMKYLFVNGELANGDESLRYETDLVKTLAFFLLKSDSAAGSNNRTSPRETVRTVLVAVNAIQKFMMTNCDVPFPIRHVDKHLYGYIGYAADDIDVAEFLEGIGSMRLKNSETVIDGHRCDAKKMLLKNVTERRTPFADMLRDSWVKFECGRKTFKEISLYVMGTDDDATGPEIVFWYLKMVRRMIVRVLCRRIMNELILFKRLTNELIGMLGKLDFFFSDSSKLPVTLYGYLKDLRRSGYQQLAPTLDFDQLKELKNDIDGYLESDKNGSADVLVLSKNRTIDQNAVFKSIVESAADFKCFVYLFELLDDDRRKYYVPGNTVRYRDARFVVEAGMCAGADAKRQQPPSSLTGSNSVCDFIVGLYQTVFETFNDLNGDGEGKFSDDPRAVGDKIVGDFDTVLPYLVVSINTRTDRRLNAMAFNLFPIVAQIEHRKNDPAELVRLLYTIMAELNGYGLDSCKGYDVFLLFKNDDTDVAGLNRKIRDQWDSLVSLETGSPDPEQPETDVALPISGVWTVAPDTRPVDFGPYNNIVRFRWKGEIRSIEEIFDGTKSIVISPADSYALYDVHIGFSIAVIYYETITFFNYLGANQAIVLPLLNQFIKIVTEFTNISNIEDRFPERFKEFAPKYQGFFRCGIHETLSNGTYTDFDKDSKDLEQMIEKFGVLLDVNAEKLSVEKKIEKPRLLRRLSSKTLSWVLKKTPSPPSPQSATKLAIPVIKHFNELLIDVLSSIERMNNELKYIETYFNESKTTQD